MRFFLWANIPNPKLGALPPSLPTASRADSQDLCFLAGEDYRNFLQRHIPEILEPGEIITTAGKVVGQHNGLANYTIGQRKGLGVASPVPLFVLTKQPADNLLVVGTLDELGFTELTAHDVNWISGEAPRDPFRALVKIRYSAKEVEAWVSPIEGNPSNLETGQKAAVKFDLPVRDVTAGQAAVFYQDELMLGGGIIQ